MKRLALFLALGSFPPITFAETPSPNAATTEPHAILQCTTGRAGLSNCKVIEESPEGQGLGTAALIGSACTALPKQNQAPSDTKKQSSESTIQVVVPFAGVSLPVAPNWSGCNATTLQASSPIVTPILTKKPNGNDFVRLYPDRAMNQGLNGKVLVQCTIEKDRLRPCSILQDNPKNMGFDKATLEIMKIFRVDPYSADGNSVDGGQYRIIVIWRAG